MKLNISAFSTIVITGASLVMLTTGCDSNCCGEVGKAAVNKTPVAVISPNYSLNGNTLTINGSRSQDEEDGTSLAKYEWFLTEDLTKTDCTGLPVKATGVQPVITGLEAGKQYQIFLKVTDKDGNVDCTSTGDITGEKPVVITVPVVEQPIACEDKPANEHADPTPVLNVYIQGTTNPVDTFTYGGKYSLSCVGSHDDCNTSIPENGGECNFNGSSWKSADGTCQNKPAPGDNSFYIENCQLDGRFKPANTPITASNMNIDLNLTTCSNQNRFNCVEIDMTVTDKYGHSSTTVKRFKVQ